MIERLSCLTERLLETGAKSDRDDFCKTGQDTDFPFLTQPDEPAANTGISCLNSSSDWLKISSQLILLIMTGSCF